MNPIKAIFIGAVCAIFVSQPNVAYATQADLDAEVVRYMKIMQGSNFQKQKRALERLSWSGIQSKKVYDAIAQKLVNLKSTDSKQGMEEAAWLAKGLGYSGMEQYRATLKDVAENADKKKVRKYAAQALDSLNTYKAWNPVINAGTQTAPQARLQQHRVANMLAANDPMLVRLGAKRVYHGNKTDAELVAKAAQRLEREYPIVSKGNDAQIDATAWLIKVVAESGDKQYRPLLETIAAKAKVKKVKKYAKKYATYLK